MKINMDADSAEQLVPPLSILTFVENSVKHSKLIDRSLEIQFKCRNIRSQDGAFLNITVADNCGGFSEEKLVELNGAGEEIYRERNVGINNVRQRLRLIYGDSAVLSFENRAGGACVELFIPMRESEENLDDGADSR